jgi:hypothetical protein
MVTMASEQDEQNSMELEAAKIAMMMHPDRDYNMSFRREGTTLVMTIVEQRGGNIPAETRLKRQDVPADILQMLECDGGELDELVHDAKGHEASAINNEGFWSQLDYLISSNWTNWDGIREHLKGG